MKRPFKILGVNHLGIAPKSPNQCANFFENILGLAHLGDENVKEQHVLTRMFSSSSTSESDTNAHMHTRMEILIPDEDPEGPIRKFLEKKGSGIHHVALAVDDVAAAILFMSANNIRMIDTHPRKGAHNTSIAFIHPESTGGILVELVQENNP